MAENPHILFNGVKGENFYIPIA